MIRKCKTKHFICCFLLFFTLFSNIFTYSSLYSGIDINDGDIDEYALDLAIKLKKEYSDDPISDLFAASYGLEKIARITEIDENLFHFKFNDDLRSDIIAENEMNPFEINKIRKKRNVRSKRYVQNKIQSIEDDDRVDYVLPQVYLNRHKRDYSHIDLMEIIDKLSNEYKNEFEIESNKISKEKKVLQTKNQIKFNDQNFDQQWYLINDGQLKIPRFHDLNVKEAWVKGYTGKNVSIVIIDDGLDHEHPDFLGKYRADLSYDFNDEDDPNHDPMPSTFDNQNNHGTRCAGAAAANANNSVCGVGVAFNAQIGGIRILDGQITDLLEARALSYKSKDVDIRSASWGPKDDGAHMEYPGHFVNLALEDGIKNGRNGKGTLYVWASGNGGGNNDDCSCDGYVSHWNIISIGSVNHRGITPYFMELCPSTMAVVYSGGNSNIDGDEDDPGVRVVASDVRGKCTTTFQGTSSAAPLAAGALALVLEANNNLTYRDVMHLIAKTARIPNIEDTSGWIVNGGRYHINEKYGFGVLDVSQMIQEAQSWENVPERKKCETKFFGRLPELKPGEKKTIELSTYDCTNIDLLEHVIANISFSYSIRGNIKMTLISPHGTPSEILSYRKNDKSKKGTKFFPFMTLFNWGENPRGTWKLIIETKEDLSESKGDLEFFSLVFYGTKEISEKSIYNKRFKDFKTRAYIPDVDTVKRIYKNELIQSRETNIKHKRNS